MNSILVIDDSAMMRRTILRLLAQAGIDFASALEAADGAEAIALGARGYIRKAFAVDDIRSTVVPLLTAQPLHSPYF